MHTIEGVDTIQSYSRRNSLTGECSGCGKTCGPGEGYLNRAANLNDIRTARKKVVWVVKCDNCHPQAANTRKPWTVLQVRGWGIIKTEVDGSPALQLNAPSFTEVITFVDRMGRLSTPRLDEILIEGKPLSRAAAEHLGGIVGRLLPMVSDKCKTPK